MAKSDVTVGRDPPPVKLRQDRAVGAKRLRWGTSATSWARRLNVQYDVGQLSLHGVVRNREAVPALNFLWHDPSMVGVSGLILSCAMDLGHFDCRFPKRR